MALGPLAVFAQQKAVVRVHDQQRVLPQAVRVHGVQHTAQVFVAHGQQGGVLATHVAHQLRAVLPVHRPVVGPVQQGAPVPVGEQVFVRGLAVEGLVGVKGLQLQKPVVFAVVQAQEFQALGKGHALALGLLGGHGRAVGKILADPVVQRAAAHVQMVFGHAVKAHQRRPGVALLAAHAVPGGVALVIGGAAVLPIVVVVAHQMGVHAGIAQQLGHGIVEGLQRAPAAVQEIVAPRVQLPPGGHAGQTARPAVVEGHRPPCQPGEIGRFRPVAAVGFQQVPVEGIVHDHNGFHLAVLPWALIRSGGGIRKGSCRISF